MSNLIKVRHPLLRSRISTRRAARHFLRHADAVLEGVDLVRAANRDVLVEELAIWAERLSLTGERAEQIRDTQSQKKSVRKIRKAGEALFLALLEADEETKERLLQYLGKFAESAPKSTEHDDLDEIRTSGKAAYISALETIARVRYFAKRTADGRGPKASPLIEVVTALASIWERATGQRIVNTRKTQTSGFPGFASRFLAASHAIAHAKNRIIWQPKKEGVRYDEATALKNAIEEVRVMYSSPASD